MPENTLAELSKMRMDVAREDLATASENARSGRFRAANNRAYYAIFHAIRAVLALDGKEQRDMPELRELEGVRELWEARELREAREHGRVLAYFIDNYLGSNIADNYLKVVINYASESCERGDCEDFYTATQEEAMRNIGGAADVIKAAETRIAARLEMESILLSDDG